MIYKDNFVFFIGDPGGQYTLSTYKVGSVNLQLSSENFFHVFDYNTTSNKISLINDRQRNTLGNKKDIFKIFDNEIITCIVRDPYQKLRSGVIQEILGRVETNYKGSTNLTSSNKILNYWIKTFFSDEGRRKYGEYVDFELNLKIAESFFSKKIFQDEFSNWLAEFLIIYWKDLAITSHCDQYYEPLFHLLNSGTIKNFNIQQLNKVNWKHFQSHHSNSLFFQGFDRAVNKAISQSSSFDKEYKLFLSTEYEYYNKLLEL